MRDKTLVAAQVGYGMFGADVVAGTMWDLQRNGIAPYLDRVGLDDWCKEYQGTGFRLAAVGTRSERSALRAQAENERETGFRPAVYHGEAPWEQILDEHDIDVLIVATPDHLHTAPILAALRRGVHVVTEKPMCLDVNEADEILSLAAEKERVVGVDMHKRYDPDHLRIFTELRQELGAPIVARGVLEEPLEVSTSTFQWAEQSDPFTYVGIHWIDLFMNYLSLRPLSLFAVGQKERLLREFGRDTFDAVQVMVTHTNGMNVIYDNNWITPADFEGPVNQESSMLGAYGKVESDSQYRGLRFWLENKGSRTANTHFFRKVRRPDGTHVSMGYGKDSLVTCLEKIYRHELLGVPVAEMAGTYPDAQSLRLPTAVVHAAREVMKRNYRAFAAGKAPLATASFGEDGIRIHDPNDPAPEPIYTRPV